MTNHLTAGPIAALTTIAVCAALGLSASHARSVEEDQVVGTLLARGICHGVQGYYNCPLTVVEIPSKERVTYIRLRIDRNGRFEAATWDSSISAHPRWELDERAFGTCVRNPNACTYVQSGQQNDRFADLNGQFIAKFK